jgi:hypothetical protein
MNDFTPLSTVVLFSDQICFHLVLCYIAMDRNVFLFRLCLRSDCYHYSSHLLSALLLCTVGAPINKL